MNDTKVFSYEERESGPSYKQAHGRHIHLLRKNHGTASTEMSLQHDIKETFRLYCEYFKIPNKKRI